MNTETYALKLVAEEIAHSMKHHPAVTAEPNPYLVMEAKRLEATLIDNVINFEHAARRDLYYYRTYNQLVYICDVLFDTTSSANANAIVVKDLLMTIRYANPTELDPALKLAKVSVVMWADDIKKQWLHYCGLMVKYDVPEKLIQIAGIPFQRFTEHKFPLCWGDYTWLKRYQSKLEMLDWENVDCHTPTDALLSLLIGRDFNDDRFFIYCKTCIKDRLKKITGKRNRVLEYARCEKLILEDTQAGVRPYDVRAHSVSDRLTKWIREEIAFVETHERDRPFAKFEFKWNVEMIAFFFKLLHERGAFGKMPLEPFAETIATNCSSIGKEDFQPATIQSRFYMKDTQVIQAIEKVLIEMLEVVQKYLR